MSHQVYISIGSNIQPEKNIANALDHLHSKCKTIITSTTYESKPVGFSGANFYNLVVGCKTLLPKREFSTLLTEIESICGRKREPNKFTSRTIDLDLLLYDGQNPHQDIEQYAFVLRPLAEIYPEGVHPVTGLSYLEMWTSFQDSTQHLSKVSTEYY